MCRSTRPGKYVLVANYDSGSVAVFPVLKDGKLGEASAVDQHSGHGPNAEHQEGPHAHQIDLSSDNRFALNTDLGLDQVLVYRFDAAKGTLAANDPPFAEVAPGAGPRHFVFHPSNKFVYVIDELGSTVTEFSYDAASGEPEAPDRSLNFARGLQRTQRHCGNPGGPCRQISLRLEPRARQHCRLRPRFRNRRTQIAGKRPHRRQDTTQL